MCTKILHQDIHGYGPMFFGTNQPMFTGLIRCLGLVNFSHDMPIWWSKSKTMVNPINQSFNQPVTSKLKTVLEYITGLMVCLRSANGETALPCHDVSHWLGTSLESALYYRSTNASRCEIQCSMVRGPLYLQRLAKPALGLGHGYEITSMYNSDK